MIKYIIIFTIIAVIVVSAVIIINSFQDQKQVQYVQQDQSSSSIQQSRQKDDMSRQRDWHGSDKWIDTEDYIAPFYIIFVHTEDGRQFFGSITISDQARKSYQSISQTVNAPKFDAASKPSDYGTDVLEIVIEYMKKASNERKNGKLNDYMNKIVQQAFKSNIVFCKDFAKFLSENYDSTEHDVRWYGTNNQTIDANSDSDMWYIYNQGQQIYVLDGEGVYPVSITGDMPTGGTPLFSFKKNNQILM